MLHLVLYLLLIICICICGKKRNAVTIIKNMNDNNQNVNDDHGSEMLNDDSQNGLVDTPVTRQSQFAVAVAL